MNKLAFSEHILISCDFMILEINPFIAAGNFDYNDFSYLDINGSRWESYGISSTTFFE